MSRRSQLAWVQKNRARRSAVRPIGAAAAAFAGDVLEHADHVVKVAGVVAPFVDAEFRRHCRLAIDDRDVLIVSVDDAPLVSVVQRRWKEQLESRLRTALRAAGVKQVRFKYGRGGLAMDRQV